MRIIAAWALAAVLVPAVMFSQYGRRTRGTTANPGAYNTPAVTFQGKLKALSKKELIIDVDGSGESLTFRVSGKTHFVKDGKDIKLKDVTLGTVVAVDANREPDLKFSALNVIVNPPKPKADAQ